MKKFSVAVIAMIMAVAMCFSSFADDPAGSITIENAQAQRTYDLYRIFDLTGSGTDSEGEYINYAYTVADKWEGFFFNSEGASITDFLILKTTENESKPDYANLNQLTHDGKIYFMDITADNVKLLAKMALAYCADNADPSADYSATPGADGNYIFSPIELGYYLIYPQGAADKMDDNGSICSLDTTSPAADVTIKATYPTIEKTVDDTDTSVEVGQKLTFTITGKVPDTTGYTAGTNPYVYKVQDTMNPGLKFDGISTVDVKVGGATVNDYELTAGTNGFTITFDMTKYQANVGKSVIITYTATVTDEAVLKVTENKAKLIYSRDPADSTKKGEAPDKNVQFYSSQIQINKYDETLPSEYLSGAEFYLLKASPSDAAPNWYYKYTKGDSTADPATDSKVEWVTEKSAATKVTTGLDGKAYFKGLEDGTYYLREEKAPVGYSLLASDVKVEVTAAGVTDSEGNKIGITKVQDVANVPGKKLPSTGGTGTTLLYIIGGILVVGAGVLLVVKKRVENEE